MQIHLPLDASYRITLVPRFFQSVVEVVTTTKLTETRSGDYLRDLIGLVPYCAVSSSIKRRTCAAPAGVEPSKAASSGAGAGASATAVAASPASSPSRASPPARRSAAQARPPPSTPPRTRTRRHPRSAASSGWGRTGRPQSRRRRCGHDLATATAARPDLLATATGDERGRAPTLVSGFAPCENETGQRQRVSIRGRAPTLVSDFALCDHALPSQTKVRCVPIHEVTQFTSPADLGPQSRRFRTAKASRPGRRRENCLSNLDHADRGLAILALATADRIAPRTRTHFWPMNGWGCSSSATGSVAGAREKLRLERLSPSFKIT